MIAKGELSEAAQECIEADDQIEEALKEEEKALRLMNKVFQKHFTGLINTLSQHKIEDSDEHRAQVKGQLELMRQDCKVFERLQHYKELVHIAGEMYSHVDKLIDQLYDMENEHVQKSKDLLHFLHREEGPLARYHDMISQDLRDLLLQDEEIEKLIKLRKTSRE
jgi:hypothetical protein